MKIYFKCVVFIKGRRYNLSRLAHICNTISPLSKKVVVFKSICHSHKPWILFGRKLIAFLSYFFSVVAFHNIIFRFGFFLFFVHIFSHCICEHWMLSFDLGTTIRCKHFRWYYKFQEIYHFLVNVDIAHPQNDTNQRMIQIIAMYLHLLWFGFYSEAIL